MVETFLYDGRKLEFPLSQNDLIKINALRNEMLTLNTDKESLNKLVKLNNEVKNIKNKIGEIAIVKNEFRIGRYKMKQGDQLQIKEVVENYRGYMIVTFYNLRVGKHAEFTQNKNQFIDATNFEGIKENVEDKDTFYIKKHGKEGFTPVDGFRFDVEGLQTFIYENNNGEFVLVEMQTGLNIANAETVEELVKTGVNLIQANKEKLSQFIEAAIKRNGGLSPNIKEEATQEKVQPMKKVKEETKTNKSELVQLNLKIDQIMFMPIVDNLGKMFGRFDFRKDYHNENQYILYLSLEENSEIILKEKITGTREEIESRLNELDFTMNIIEDEQEIASNAPESIVSDNKKLEYKDIKIEFKVQNKESESSTFRHEQQGKEIEFSSG
ncbi:hypothetical protein [Priestia flexa]|uniref:hypothetical protein n=1 Tax=Priestia flexa TaxID=86664 RepID=UPI000473FBCD|nr:hypothetical protein [Priestia flexa]